MFSAKSLKTQRSLATFSLADSLLFFGIDLSISNFVGSKAGYSWLLFIGLIPPFIGIIFASYMLVKVYEYWKILPFLGLITNITIFLIAFLSYAFVLAVLAKK